MKKMKYLFTAACLILFWQVSTAQNARDFFTFQGVARDASGKIVANTNISLRLTIHPLLNTAVFSEQHSASTDAHGVFRLLVGGGQTVSGNFETINWSSGYYFLQVEIDIAGGSNYVNQGSTQLVSVPYALHAKQADRWENNVPIIQTGFFDIGEPIQNQTPGTRLIWYPKKAAFRAGYINSDAWDNVNIGKHSAAFGFDTKAFGTSAFSAGNITSALGTASLSSGDRSVASGNFSTAMGSETQAQGTYATSLGRETVAKGPASTAIGIQNIADGTGSFAAGYLTNAVGNMSFSTGEGTYAKAFASTTIGSYNNVQDNPSGPLSTQAKPTDRIFQIGNGGGPNSLSNALTVLRNGNVGLGNGANNPQYILEIDGRPRIRHTGQTAGLFLSNSVKPEGAFVGMKLDDQVGFYIGDAWRFWVSELGNAELTGTLKQNSDRRLKRDFLQLNNSLEKISMVDGYQYYWKDKKADQSLQTGVIAQEIEVIFPELVSTNEKGFKSVNYIGLIPHLVEAIKELKTENDQLKGQLNRLDQLEASFKNQIEKMSKLGK